MEDLNYKDIGFKGGIEIHQQINTRKLFCECPTRVRIEEPDDMTKRKLHAVASEMGEYDPAALHEVHRDRTFYYQSYRDSVCLVELDEEPPHPVNKNALEVVLQAGLTLNARVVDEIQVMRKTVIDGSNTAGFQRTMLVCTDGKIDTDEGEVFLQYFCLEEDAARIIETNDREVIFRLDRLGIPLLEIVTGPVFVSPKQAGEVADKLGHIIRALNVRRGIGSIRQDVNVSTKFGTRIEIKGVQKHRMIPVIMKYEAKRQKSLFEIGEELRNLRSKFTPAEFKENTFNITDALKNTSFHTIRKIIDNNGEISAIKLPQFKGYLSRELCPNKRLGTEFKERILTLGIKGVVHSDEDLEKYEFSENELFAVRTLLNLTDEDAFLFFACKKEITNKALSELYIRINQCFDGVPKESRRALKDGNTQYMRPLPGDARMYPETDIPPVRMAKEYVNKVRQELPDIPEMNYEELSNKYGLALSDLRKISGNINSLIYGIEELKLKPNVVCNILSNNIIEKGMNNGSDFKPDTLNNMLKALKEGKIVNEAVPEVLEKLHDGILIDNIIDDLTKKTIDIDKEIKTVINSNRPLLENPKAHAILMGKVMQKVRGRIDGAAISKKLQILLDKEISDK
ncbi:Glu-tRNA(Gln) amidotransferase subunit GatE [candidate division KSB1 bacterium]